MAVGRGWGRLGAVLGLAALTLGVGLGRAGRLTYHEAFVAQAAREMLASGDALTPTLGGRPWLEKPPLAIWLVALAGRASGAVSEVEARAPSAAAAALLALGVASFGARRFGTAVGWLAGLVQVTTAWTVMRGRLAEADMALACLVTWTLVAFDRLRDGPAPAPEGPAPPGRLDRVRARWAGLDAWRWAFFAGLGLTSLAKGVGFGAALALAAVALVVAWDRDRATLRRLRYGPGWALAAGLALTWPALAALRHPSALRLWFLHVADRLAARPEHFAGQGWGAYAVATFAQLLPWAPLALAGAWRSLPRALGRSGRGGGDRLLWAWAVGPLALLSLATVRHAHYAIHALPPWSVWSALGLVRLGERWQARGWSPGRVRRAMLAAFGGLGVAYALGFALLGPAVDRRGVEWAFYEEAARRLRPGEPVALLYHVPDWDREPYATPFGPVPHDWAVRLFYLNRPAPAPCRFGLDDLAARPPALAPGAPPSASFAVIGRPTDLAPLRRLGRVETLARGPATRSDRTYHLFRVTPGAEPAPPVAVRDDQPRPR